MQHNPNLVLVMYAFFTLYRPHWLFGLAKWETLVHLAVTVIVVLASCLFLFVCFYKYHKDLHYHT